MYQNHFKLQRRLFRGNASGPDVFVGPQMAKIMSGISQDFHAFGSEEQRVPIGMPGPRAYGIVRQ